MEVLKAATPRSQAEVDTLRNNVAEIIQTVREHGDQALLEYNTRLDGNSRPSFRVTREEIDAAYGQLTAQELADLRQAAANIRAFAQAKRGCLKELEGVAPVCSTAGSRTSLPF